MVPTTPARSSWKAYTGAPTRREITLVLFGICVFALAYNLESSLRAAGLDAGHGVLSRTLSRASSAVTGALDVHLGPDGRRLPGWADELEDAIFGEWEWPAGDVAKGPAHPPVGEGDRFLEGAVWGKLLKGEKYDAEDAATSGWAVGNVNGGMVNWTAGVPQTQLLQHVAGYTVMDSVVWAQGILYVVTDDLTSFPLVDRIISKRDDPERSGGNGELQFITTAQANERWGSLVGVIHGTSWLATGPSSVQDSHTLLTLWRLHSSLPSSLPPPLRLITPHIPTYLSHNEDPKIQIAPPRSPLGADPPLLRAVLPSAGLWGLEDWDDFANMPRPFVFARLALADRGAARRAHPARPSWATAYSELSARAGGGDWLAPLRVELLAHLRLDPAELGKGKKVVTYLSTQAMSGTPKLEATTHDALVEGLGKLAHDRGYELHVVEAGMSWEERMLAVMRATVVIGVAQDRLADALFLRPGHGTILELFSNGIFIDDHAVPAQALGINYVASWQGEQQFTGSKLPATKYPDDEEAWARTRVPLEVKKLLDAVQSIAAKA